VFDLSLIPPPTAGRRFCGYTLPATMPTAVRTAHPSYSLFVLCTTFVVLVLPCTYAFGVTPQRSKQQAAAQAGSGLSAGLGRR
jgi:hypothetical protein